MTGVGLGVFDVAIEFVNVCPTPVAESLIADATSSQRYVSSVDIVN